ncbi:hypothetical protein GCM10010358_48710 [Streptomyces minutiscleroticus]|uniref:Serine/threonine protein kinase n=1 Tax=Streptomyces minutiscleroticus TaxID=68238 RepID=A0A918NRI1_9ACTN|nr:hypothetical protein [Streptomyces minutiscleroticus]GGX88934.1 hypothetical protein GCM10010358_48710 [Streptomyces minutiscleroticus]
MPRPAARWRLGAQPRPLVHAALESVLDAHLAVEEAGSVAVGPYDGCMLYDFDAHRMVLCDLDEYRPGPFVLAADRLPGSRRCMAPETFVRGAPIDIRTTVFVLGRAIRLLLDTGDEEDRWRAGRPASGRSSGRRPPPLRSTVPRPSAPSPMRGGRCPDGRDHRRPPRVRSRVAGHVPDGRSLRRAVRRRRREDRSPYLGTARNVPWVS